MQSLYHVPQTKLKRCECPVDLSVANIWQFRVTKSESKNTPRTTRCCEWHDVGLRGRRYNHKGAWQKLRRVQWDVANMSLTPGPSLKTTRPYNPPVFLLKLYLSRGPSFETSLGVSTLVQTNVAEFSNRLTYWQNQVRICRRYRDPKFWSVINSLSLGPIPTDGSGRFQQVGIPDARKFILWCNGWRVVTLATCTWVSCVMCHDSI